MGILSLSCLVRCDDRNLSQRSHRRSGAVYDGFGSNLRRKSDQAAHGQEQTMGDGVHSGRSCRLRSLPEVITRGCLSRLSNRQENQWRLRARPRLLLTRNVVPVKLKMYLDKTR